MKRYYVLFLILEIFFVFKNNYAQQELSLSEAITIALHQNSSLIESQNSLKTNDAAIKTAYGNLLPNLNLNSSWNWQRVSDKGGETQLDYFGNETILPASKNDTRNYSLTAGGSITLFNGLGNIANINLAKNNFESAKLSLEKQKQDIILQTASLYLSVISYDSLLKYQDENLKYNQELLKEINEKQQLKMVTLADVYSQQAQTANSELSFLQAKTNYEKAIISLLDYLSLDVDKNYSFSLPSKSEYDSSLINEDYNSLVQFALSHRSDYLSEKYTIESNANQLTIARAGLFPSLTGNYQISTAATNLNSMFNRNTYGVGLSLNIPIFSNWNTKYEIEAASVLLLNSNENLKQLERQIKSDVKNALLDLQTSKVQLDVSEKALLSAKESWEVENESYKIGKVTYIELQQTYNNYLQAITNQIQAQYNYYTKQFAMLNAIGNLNNN
jgi:outer membrane protein